MGYMLMRMDRIIRVTGGGMDVCLTRRWKVIIVMPFVIREVFGIGKGQTSEFGL